jgi:hypothetical protein
VLWDLRGICSQFKKPDPEGIRLFDSSMRRCIQLAFAPLIRGNVHAPVVLTQIQREGEFTAGLCRRHQHAARGVAHLQETRQAPAFSLV